MATTTTNPKISLKLLIDTNSNKVLFAEAGKDFVDLLFGFLELPLGTILALLTKLDDTTATYGSLSKVYQSVQNLDNDYLQPNQTKYALLRPKIGVSNTAQTPLLKQFLAMADPPNQTNVIHPSLFGSAPSFSSAFSFGFSSAPSFSSASSFSSSPSFSSASSFGFSSAPSFGSGSSFGSSPSFSSASSFGFSSAPSFPSFAFTSAPSFSSASVTSNAHVSTPSFAFSSAPSFSSTSATSNVHVNMVQGCVKGVVTYMVMDDLMVEPMSSISNIALLKNLKVKDITLELPLCLQ